MKELFKLFGRKDLISVRGMTSCLGYRTERAKLDKLRFSKWEDWLRDSDKNSIQLIFENETIDFKL